MSGSKPKNKTILTSNGIVMINQINDKSIASSTTASSTVSTSNGDIIILKTTNCCSDVAIQCGSINLNIAATTTSNSSGNISGGEESGSEISSIKSNDDVPKKCPNEITTSGGIGLGSGNDDKILSNGREARNRAEKQRRDKLNGSIADLATMVPHVAESPRRVDKTAVLRYSAHGLRIRYVFGKTFERSQTDNIGNNLIVTDSLMKLLDGFLLTVTCRGQIVLISPSVEQHLGHCQTDLFGQNILNITHPEDHAMLKKKLIPTDLENMFDIQPEEENGEPRPRTDEEEKEIDRRLSVDRRNFILKLSRATPRSEPTTYEIVKIDGCFRRADSAPRGVKASTYPSGLQLIRRARGRDDSVPLHSISGNDIVLVAMARIIKPPKILDRFIEADQYEYKTRHLIDGRIIQCEQKISLVAGYMTQEVNGLSPFTFMHQDDVRWVIVALRQMYDSNSSYGESCYRLLTRTGHFIYLKTRGYLEIDKETNTVHSFVCVNSLVNEEEGKRRVQEMKNKFSIIINTKIPESTIDAPACDNPQQLEKAVIYLIENLDKTNNYDVCNDDTDSFKSTNDDTTACSSGISKTSNNGKLFKTESLGTKSPILALIPPKTSSIKSSISESVRLVKVTAANNFHLNKLKTTDESDSDSNGSLNSGDTHYLDANKLNKNTSSSDNCKIDDLQQKQIQQQTNRPSVLYKSGSSSSKCNINNINNNNNNNSENIITTIPSNVAIKEEIVESSSENDSRVPPLPNSVNYHETMPLIMSISKNINNCNNSSKYKLNNSNKNSVENIKFNTIDQLSSKLSSTSTLKSIGQPTSVLKRSRSSIDDLSGGANVKRSNTTISRTVGSGRIPKQYVNSISIQELKNPQKELDQVLTNSLVQINRSLSKIETATTELRGHCSSYPIPNSQNRLEEIIEEHHDQKEMLENIQNQYAHLQRQTTSNKPITTIIPLTQTHSTIIGTNSTMPSITLPSELTIIHPAVIEKTDESLHHRKIIELKPR